MLSANVLPMLMVSCFTALTIAYVLARRNKPFPSRLVAHMVVAAMMGFVFLSAHVFEAHMNSVELIQARFDAIRNASTITSAQKHGSDLLSVRVLLDGSNYPINLREPRIEYFIYAPGAFGLGMIWYAIVLGILWVLTASYNVIKTK